MKNHSEKQTFDALFNRNIFAVLRSTNPLMCVCLYAPVYVARTLSFYALMILFLRPEVNYAHNRIMLNE